MLERASIRRWVADRGVTRYLRRQIGRPHWADERTPVSEHEQDGTFDRIFHGHTGRYVTKWDHYGQIYDRELTHFRDVERVDDSGRGPVHFLEIGVHKGGSLELWREFFGPSARLLGVDIDEECRALSSDDLPVRIGSQSDPDFLRHVVDEMGGLDIVLDDGSHRARDQRSSFKTLFPLLSDGGLYVVEDTHTAYWLGHGGGFRRPGSFVEYAKRLVDGIHGWYYLSPDRELSRWARREIASVRFYDSIIVIEKRLRREHPTAVETG